MMDHYKLYSMICTLLISFFWVCLPPVSAGEKLLFRIGTGGKTGVYYPIGKLIAQGMTEPVAEHGIPGVPATAVPGCIAVAQNSAGSVENVKTIIAGETEAGLVQADVAFSAYTSSGPFSPPQAFNKLRAVASLYPEKLQIVVRQDAGISTITDLRGKHISLDEAGSGTLSVMRIILATHNLSEKDLQPVYLKPVFTHEKMISNDLHGFGMMAGTPMEAVLSLSKIGVTLVPVPQEASERIHAQYPYLVPGMIAADVYPGIGRTPTLQVHALLAVSADLDTDLVYQVTKALWSPRTRALLDRGHPQGRSILLETALKGLSIPLHDGAEKFYREHGLGVE